MLKISIIVPVYNVEQYIGECFDSIASQTYRGGIECIFVDDCGKDQSIVLLEKMIREYRGNISFSIQHHQTNKGLSAARNTGIFHASGEYLYFLDSDDTVTPDCIEKLEAIVELYPGIDIVQGSTKGKYDWLSMKEKAVPNYSDNQIWIRKTMLKRSVIPMTAWNKLVCRKFVLAHHLFFEEGLVHEDELWNFMLSKYVTRIAFCRDITHIYRDNPKGITGKMILPNYLPLLELMVDRVSKPELCSEILCIYSIAGNNYDDIISRLYRYKGVKVWLHNLKQTQIHSKYTFVGFFYRVINRIFNRCLMSYINYAN